MKFYSLIADAKTTVDTGVTQACGTSCNKVELSSIFSTLTDTLIYLVGAISVIMIVIGGLRYILSNGDPKGANDAKNTILYSVIGVIVAIAGYAIVHFVVSAF